MKFFYETGRPSAPTCTKALRVFFERCVALVSVYARTKAPERGSAGRGLLKAALLAARAARDLIAAERLNICRAHKAELLASPKKCQGVIKKLGGEISLCRWEASHARAANRQQDTGAAPAHQASMLTDHEIKARSAAHIWAQSRAWHVENCGEDIPAALDAKDWPQFRLPPLPRRARSGRRCSGQTLAPHFAAPRWAQASESQYLPSIVVTPNALRFGAIKRRRNDLDLGRGKKNAKERNQRRGTTKAAPKKNIDRPNAIGPPKRRS